jgi:hypothetical protein
VGGNLTEFSTITPDRQRQTGKEKKGTTQPPTEAKSTAQQKGQHQINKGTAGTQTTQVT